MFHQEWLLSTAYHASANGETGFKWWPTGHRLGYSREVAKECAEALARDGAITIDGEGAYFNPAGRARARDIERAAAAKMDTSSLSDPEYHLLMVLKSSDCGTIPVNRLASSVGLPKFEMREALKKLNEIDAVRIHGIVDEYMRDRHGDDASLTPGGWELAAQGMHRENLGAGRFLDPTAGGGGLFGGATGKRSGGSLFGGGPRKSPPAPLIPTSNPPSARAVDPPVIALPSSKTPLRIMAGEDVANALAPAKAPAPVKRSPKSQSKLQLLRRRGWKIIKGAGLGLWEITKHPVIAVLCLFGIGVVAWVRFGWKIDDPTSVKPRTNPTPQLVAPDSKPRTAPQPTTMP